MENIKIIKQFTRFFYPFKYNKDIPQNKLKDSRINSKGKNVQVWESCGIKVHELREGVSDFYLDIKEGERQSRIANCYELKDRVSLDLPHNKSNIFKFIARENKENNYSIKITNIRLYLFESEVGFAEISCEYQSKNIDDYIKCNYYISEIKADENIFKFVRHNEELQEVEKEKTVKELLKEILSYVEGVKYFDNAGKEFYEKKPMIFSYVLIDKKPDDKDLKELLFYARKNFKETYKLPQSEYDIENNPNIYQTFENSYWATSLNGVINVSFLVDNDKTNNFFINNFEDRLLGSYLHLFLSVLHQKYAIRHLLSKIGCLYEIVEEKELKRAMDYQEQAAKLKLRAFFKIPSNIEHVNKYYRVIRNTYEIDDIYINFNDDIKNIVSICDSIDKEEKNLRKNDIDANILILGPLLALITLIGSSWHILGKVFDDLSKLFIINNKFINIIISFIVNNSNYLFTGFIFIIILIVLFPLIIGIPSYKIFIKRQLRKIKNSKKTKEKKKNKQKNK